MTEDDIPQRRKSDSVDTRLSVLEINFLHVTEKIDQVIDNQDNMNVLMLRQADSLDRHVRDENGDWRQFATTVQNNTLQTAVINETLKNLNITMIELGSQLKRSDERLTALEKDTAVFKTTGKVSKAFVVIVWTLGVTCASVMAYFGLLK